MNTNKVVGIIRDSKLSPNMRKKLLAKLLSKKANVDFNELLKGMDVEKEHARTLGNDSPKLLARIALDHLREDPHYYTKLDKMENPKQEVSTTAAAPGYNIPGAFQGNSEKNKRRKRKIASTSGMKVIGNIGNADKL